MNEIIAHKKDFNNEIFWDYFKYKNLSFLAKVLIRATQDKHEQLVNNVNVRLIELRNSIIRKEIPENENPNKIVDIIERALDFSKQQKGKKILRLKILTSKQMLQILPIALAQVKGGGTSENLLNEIRQIIYSFNREKEITKKAHSNIMNSIKL